MAKRRRRPAPRSSGTVRPDRRPVAWSALLGAAVATALAGPSYANPVGPTGVPDAGSRPTPVGPLQLPGAPAIGGSTAPLAPGAPTGSDPLATEIQTREVALAGAGDRLLKLREEQSAVQTQRAMADARLRDAREALRRAQETADAVAASALKDAAGLPPGAFGSDLHGLGELARMQRGQSAGQQAATRDLAIAQEAEQVALAEFTAVVDRERALTGEYERIDADRRRQELTLAQLRQRNAERIAEFEREREQLDQQIGEDYTERESIDGKAADPRALAALRYALAQIGDRYVWATEGPDTFDCSGLMWAAYRTPAAGPYYLPRVSRDQYYATRQRSVDRYSLLPGDLVFFSSSSSWTGIHHVGMYVGDGKMVHAPNANERVQVSTVWWSRFFAATRVYGPVDAPGGPPAEPKPTPGKPSPSPSKPSPTPSRPSPSPTSPSPSPSSPAPSPTSPSPSPSSSSPGAPPTSPPVTPPTSSPTATPSAGASTPGAGPSATGMTGSPSITPGGSASGSASATPSGSASGSAPASPSGSPAGTASVSTSPSLSR